MSSGTRPEWMIEKREQLQMAYAEMAMLLIDRAKQVQATGRKDRDGVRHDKLGTAQDYEADAMYCLFMSSGKSPLAAEGKAAAAVRKGWTQEQAWGDLAALQQARADEIKKRPPPPPVPETDDALRLIRVEWFLQRFPQREAEALILTIGLQMTHREASSVMNCSVSRVNALVFQARQKFGKMPWECA